MQCEDSLIRTKDAAGFDDKFLINVLLLYFESQLLSPSINIIIIYFIYLLEIVSISDHTVLSGAVISEK
jgi:hypothetical protein